MRKPRKENEMTKTVKALLAAGLLAASVIGVSFSAAADGNEEGFCIRVNPGPFEYFQVFPEGEDPYFALLCPEGFSIIN